jgi:hypothetical protein
MLVMPLILVLERADRGALAVPIGARLVSAASKPFPYPFLSS